MIITQEIKEKFARMLDARQIIVVQCNRSISRKTYDYKFIGCDGYGKWDFTPLVAELTDFSTNKCERIQYLVIRGNGGADIVYEVMRKLQDEGIAASTPSGHSLYEYCRDKLSTFYL